METRESGESKRQEPVRREFVRREPARRESVMHCDRTANEQSTYSQRAVNVQSTLVIYTVYVESLFK